jgi:hypothetical protein
MHESGLYWVKIYQDGDWTIGDFYSAMNSWLVLGSDESLKDEDFSIGKRIACPIEQDGK